MTDVIVTIENERYMTVTFEASQKGDKLIYTADGMRVYLRRAKKGVRADYGRIRNTVLNICAGMNIPLMSLRDARKPRKKKQKPANPKQGKLL